MFLVEGALGIGTLVGNLIASYILAATGTIGVFVIAASMDLVAVLYIIIFITESLHVKHERTKVNCTNFELRVAFFILILLFFLLFQSHVREFFKFDLIKDLVKSCLKRRPHFDRGIIWCIMFALISTTFVQRKYQSFIKIQSSELTTNIIVFLTEGEANVLYLFLRNKFNFTLQQFTTFTAVGIGIKMIGCGIILVLLRVVSLY